MFTQTVPDTNINDSIIILVTKTYLMDFSVNVRIPETTTIPKMTVKVMEVGNHI